MIKKVGYSIMLSLLILISCDLESEHKLGDGYYVMGDGANAALTRKTPGKKGVYTEVITGEISDYGFDDNFIIVHRTISEKAKNYFEDHELWKEQLGNGDTIQFWIVNKSNDSLYGPFNKQDYLVKRKDIGVPESLKFFE